MGGQVLGVELGAGMSDGVGDRCPCLVGGFVICSSQLLVMAELCVHIKDKHVHRNIERKKMTCHVLKFN